MSRTKKFAFSLITFVVAVVLLELAAHAVMLAKTGEPAWQFPGRPDLDLDHPYLPFLRSGVANPRTDAATSRLLRGPELGVRKDGSEFRILIIGSSSAVDRAPYAESWAGILQENLRKAVTGRDIKVVVQAHSGWLTSENLIFFALRNQDYSFDLVIVYDGGTDMNASCTPGFVSDYSHARARPGGDLTRSPLIALSYAVEKLQQVSAIARLSATLTLLSYYANENAIGEAMWKPGHAPNLGCWGVDTYRRNLESLARIGNGSGAQMLFVSHSDSMTVPTDRDSWIYYALMREHNRLMAEVAGETGSLFLDLASTFPLARENFRDRTHFSPRGSAIQAELLSDYIVRNRLAENANRRGQRRHVVLPFSELSSARWSHDGSPADLRLEGLRDGAAAFPVVYLVVPERPAGRELAFRLPLGFMPGGRYGVEAGLGYTPDSYVTDAPHGTTEYAVRIVDSSGNGRTLTSATLAPGPSYTPGRIETIAGDFDLAPGDYELEFAVRPREGESHRRHFWRYPIIRAATAPRLPVRRD